MEYWFTYEKSGPLCDTPHFTYTVGSGGGGGGGGGTGSFPIAFQNNTRGTYTNSGEVRPVAGRGVGAVGERQERKLFQLMASGEPVRLTSPMASVKKLGRLAFIAQQFGYEYADVRQAGGRNNALVSRSQSPPPVSHTPTPTGSPRSNSPSSNRSGSHQHGVRVWSMHGQKAVETCPGPAPP
ncbi:hypothetical protein [Streptomyces lutosisoli]|uniref:Uncharacterized protein n=1 Tax=Streptomyces lutosisoli TaxID=2665721 RepID=A0ABW2VUH2_9ACTN